MSRPAPTPAPGPGPAARTPTAATPTAATGRAPSPRGRRTARPSGDERELAILTTAERLLAEQPLTAISIDDLARGAGISRPTFYFYFASKDAVLLALLDRVIAQVNATARTVLDDVGSDPATHWRSAIRIFYETFREHRTVVVAAAALRGSHSEGRRLWAGVMNLWTGRTAAAIEAERARGAAPDGIPAHDLAVILNSTNERVLYGTLTGDGPAVPESTVVDSLATVWLRAIYGTTTPAGR